MAAARYPLLQRGDELIVIGPPPHRAAERGELGADEALATRNRLKAATGRRKPKASDGAAQARAGTPGRRGINDELFAAQIPG